MQLDLANAIAAVAAGVAAVSAVAALVSALASWRQVRLMREELDKRERPYVYGHFHTAHGAIVRFSLENKGSVAAIKVKAHFEEPAPIQFTELSLNSVALFRNTIAFFPPGERFTVDVDWGMDMFAEGRPTLFKLNLSYQTPSGREIADSIVFDISYLRSFLDPPPSATDILEQVKNTLDKISSVMDKWRKQEASAGKGLSRDEGGKGVD